jgi:DNA-binding HxlR family transcriptional regulator
MYAARLPTKEGTRKIYTHPKESDPMPAARPHAAFPEMDPRVEALVTDVIGRVADKWTMLILETLTEQGALRFTQIGKAVPGISQKMLTQTLRQMERDGLVTRTIHPVIPPRVEYRLTDLGDTLAEAFCGVWIWAATHLERIEAARAAFDARTTKG